MKKRMTILVPAVVILTMLFVATFATAQQTKALQLEPKRHSSTGDSITEAIDAELPLANHWASWVNGYHGFWEWLFGLTDVYSHNQVKCIRAIRLICGICVKGGRFLRKPCIGGPSSLPGKDHQLY